MPDGIDTQTIARLLAFAGVLGLGYAILVRKEKPRLAENIALVFAGGASLTSLILNIVSLKEA